MLATGLYDEAYVQMNLDMNWDAVNTINTQYSAPDGMEQGLYSESYEEASSGTNGAGGVPGTSSNSGDNSTTYYVSDGTNSTSEYSVKSMHICLMCLLQQLTASLERLFTTHHQ